ncbi:MAG: hypothetical protein E3J21_12045 [Anaerolineales bacterium]|nr:MAG: hypothetical protein E3J21_12045 [Anaerolineales bacterium]
MEPVRDYELKAFFTYVIEVLENLGIPYMVVGGFAAIFYGEPRLTIDVDIVVDVEPEHIKPLVAAFPVPDYYVSEEGIRDSLQRGYPFNVIQPATGAKVDLVPLPRDPFTRSAFQRRQRLEFDEAGRSATFITPEDIIVAKLIAHRETGSDKHLRDARGVLVMQWGELNLGAIRRSARANEVLEQFEALLEAAHRELEE